MTIFENKPKFCKLVFTKSNKVTRTQESLAAFNIVAFILGQGFSLVGMFILFIAAFLGKSIQSAIIYTIALMVVSSVFGIWFIYSLLCESAFSFDVSTGEYNVKGRGFNSSQRLSGKIRDIKSIQVKATHGDSFDPSKLMHSVYLSVDGSEDIIICKFANKTEAEKLAKKLGKKLNVQVLI